MTLIQTQHQKTYLFKYFFKEKKYHVEYQQQRLDSVSVIKNIPHIKRMWVACHS